MAPLDPFAILAAKIAANLRFLLLSPRQFCLPVFAALYTLNIMPDTRGGSVLIMVLGTLALATVGTVFSAISSQAPHAPCCCCLCSCRRCWHQH